MFQVELGRSGRYCDGVNRRSFLQLGVAGMASLGLPQILKAKSESVASRGTKNTKVILIWLDGGPGHMDMYDMKPDAAAEYRGLWKPIKTKVPGYDITELYPKQAKITDKFSIVRSLHHDTGDHFAGGHRMLTTKDMGVSGANNGQKFPGIGAIIDREIGSRQHGLPGYVAIPYGMSIGLRPGYFGGHMLGAQHNPFETVSDAAAPNFTVPNLGLTAGLSIQKLDDRRSLSKITQGVTTEIMGEAWTPSPFGGRITDPFRDTFPLMASDRDAWSSLARTWTRFGDWPRWLESAGVSVNVGSFVGDGAVREWGKGLALGEASPDELAAMTDMLAACMDDGAFGLATALIYPPGCYATTEELVALCEVVAAYRGVHITHMRSEESRLLEGLEETLEIASRTGVATEIYHLKAAGRPNWPKMAEVIQRIDSARAGGLDVTADMYPYIAAGTGLASCLPPWAEADGKLWDNLADPAMRARIRAAMIAPADDWENLGASAGPEGVILA